MTKPELIRALERGATLRPLRGVGGRFVVQLDAELLDVVQFRTFAKLKNKIVPTNGGGWQLAKTEPEKSDD